MFSILDAGEIQNQQNRRRRSSSLNRKSSADLEMLKKVRYCICLFKLVYLKQFVV